MAVRLEVGSPVPAGPALGSDPLEQAGTGRFVRKQRGRLGFSLVRVPLGHPGMDEAEVDEEHRQAAARAREARRSRPLDDQFQLGLPFRGRPVVRGV